MEKALFLCRCSALLLSASAETVIAKNNFGKKNALA